MTTMMSQQVVAEMLGVPERTLEQWRYRRVGPAFVKVGRHVRYRVDAVEAWLDSQTTTPAGDAA